MATRRIGATGPGFWRNILLLILLDGRWSSNQLHLMDWCCWLATVGGTTVSSFIFNSICSWIAFKCHDWRPHSLFAAFIVPIESDFIIFGLWFEIRFHGHQMSGCSKTIEDSLTERRFLAIPFLVIDVDQSTFAMLPVLKITGRHCPVKHFQIFEYWWRNRREDGGRIVSVSVGIPVGSLVIQSTFLFKWGRRNRYEMATPLESITSTFIRTGNTNEKYFPFIDNDQFPTWKANFWLLVWMRPNLPHYEDPAS